MAEAPAKVTPAKAPVAKPVEKPAAKPVAKKPAADLPPIGAKPAAMPIAAKGEIIIDPANSPAVRGQPHPAKRGGKNVLICKRPDPAA